MVRLGVPPTDIGVVSPYRSQLKVCNPFYVEQFFFVLFFFAGAYFLELTPCIVSFVIS